MIRLETVEIYMQDLQNKLGALQSNIDQVLKEVIEGEFTG